MRFGNWTQADRTMLSEHLTSEHPIPGHLADPLRRFPIFKTSDPEEFNYALLTRFGARRTEMKSPVNLLAQGNLAQLHSIGLVYGTSSVGVSVDYPEADRFRLLTAVVGGGEATIGGKSTGIGARQSCIVSPGQPMRLAT